MRDSARLALGLFFLLGGGAAVAEAFLSGGAHFALVVVIPVLYGSSPWLALGALGIFGGIVVLLGFWTVPLEESGEGRGSPPLPTANPGASTSTSPGNPPRSGTSYGGFLLIGPVPILFGNRREMMPYVLAMGILLVVGVLLFILFW